MQSYLQSARRQRRADRLRASHVILMMTAGAGLLALVLFAIVTLCAGVR